MFKVNITDFKELRRNCSMLAIRVLRDHLILQKIISYPMIRRHTSAYQGVRKISLSENVLGSPPK